MTKVQCKEKKCPLFDGVFCHYGLGYVGMEVEFVCECPIEKPTKKKKTVRQENGLDTRLLDRIRNLKKD